MKSARGSQGGYLLSRDSSEITLYDVIISVDKEFKSKRCLNASMGCQPSGIRCLTHDLWAKLDDVIEHFFKGLTLHDVLSRKVSDMVFLMPAKFDDLQTIKEAVQ